MTPLPSISLRIAAVAAALAAVLPGATASATIFRLPRYAMFYATAEGRQVTTWKRSPTSGGDCYSHYDTTASGSETITWKAPRRKILVANPKGTNVVSWRVGTWDEGSARPNYWGAQGANDRRDATTTTYGDGPCGHKSTPPPAPPAKDCGSHYRHFELQLGSDPITQRLTVGAEEVQSEINPDPPFEHCDVFVPDEVYADSFTAIDQKFPVDEIFDPHIGKEIVLAHKTFKQDDGHGNVATTQVRWTLTLTRHKGA